jgi:hypothetical protein
MRPTRSNAIPRSFRYPLNDKTEIERDGQVNQQVEPDNLSVLFDDRPEARRIEALL